ncbi:hypothetical protein GGX14DRAFT_406555 [Mycena pura]|uniref:Uncharacterized protein n=1 Tax=Mycena pura TaxID=153505 RepID=A0AAD6UTS3_9AGAR|nr:hypothetical protein GGX14DRAFT_406555 [Mycena pura]
MTFMRCAACVQAVQAISIATAGALHLAYLVALVPGREARGCRGLSDIVRDGCPRRGNAGDDGGPARGGGARRQDFARRFTGLIVDELVILPGSGIITGDHPVAGDTSVLLTSYHQCGYAKVPMTTVQGRANAAQLPCNCRATGKKGAVHVPCNVTQSRKCRAESHCRASR